LEEIELMKNVVAALGAIVALAACAAAANPPLAEAHESHAGVQCTIRETPTRYGMRFDVLARSDRAAYGEYDFVLTKSDRGGSSDIVQGGAFDLRAREQQSLGSTELSLERGARYRARLVLRDGDAVVCRDEARS
jgi:hypothetical protein